MLQQHHITLELHVSVKELGLPSPEYDVVAEVWVDNLEDWKNIAGDEDFRRLVVR